MCLNSTLHEEEIKFHLSQAQTVCIGPGLGQSDHAWHWLESVLSLKCRLVLDADALNLVAQDNALKALLCSRADPSLTVITPHPGEAARLLQVDIQTIQSERLGCAKKLSEEYSSLVVLKGSGSLCVAPSVLGYNHYHCSYGNAGMGSAGMGDALTGLIGSLSAQGVAHQLDLWKASVLAVDLHARAGDVLSRMESGDTFITAMKGVDEVYSPIETPALLGLHAFELAPVIRRMLHLSLIGHP
jgi:hydroxyethylthiazole kinase-like uncharacterized protein yjeF